MHQCSSTDSFFFSFFFSFLSLSLSLFFFFSNSCLGITENDQEPLIYNSLIYLLHDSITILRGLSRALDPLSRTKWLSRMFSSKASKRLLNLSLTLFLCIIMSIFQIANDWIYLTVEYICPFPANFLLVRNIVAMFEIMMTPSQRWNTEP